MKILFSFLLAFACCIQYGNAQQLTKKHRVKKGETVYHLSRVYNVSPQEIISLNPNSENVIYVDEVLLIPSNGQTIGNNNSTQSNNQNQTIAHHVLRGETKYGLSKKYGLTIAELEQQNPHIKNGLQAGHYLSISSSNLPTVSSSSYKGVRYHNVQKGETLYRLSKQYEVTIQDIKSANPEMTILKYGTTIAIPATTAVVDNNNEASELEDNLVNEVTETINETENAIIETPPTEEPKDNNTIETVSYEDYTIKPKETLYSLSKQANMSMEAFVDLNPELKKSVMVGTVIKMPVASNKTEIVPVEQSTNQPTSIVGQDNLLKTIDRTSKKKILFVMPFTESEFNNSLHSKSSIETDYERNLNFYRGSKIALDSIEKFGISVNSDIIEIDIESTVTPSNIRSKNNSLEGYDAVIAPSYSDNIDWLVSLAKDRNIPVVTAYNATNNSNLTNVVEAYPSINIQKLKILDYLKTQQGNLILISDYNRENSRNFIITNAPEIKIIETKRNGNYSSRDLTNLLEESKTNYVIIDSDKNGVFLNTTNTLLRELSQFKIQLVVLEKSLIPSEEDISAKRFTILKMLYPEVNHTMVSNLNTLAKNLKSKYGTESSPIAQEGFDITYDTLLRLCQNNYDYTNSLNEVKTTHSTLEFNYKITKSGRHVNDIILVKEFKSSDSNN